MIGESTSTHTEGIIFRAVRKLFDAKKELETSSLRGDVQVEISVELLEVYNETVRDLLASNCDREICLKLNSNEAVGNIVASVDSKDDVYEILRLATRRRCTKATNSNAQSSRSHMLFTMNFSVVNTKHQELSSTGKVHICDLAGSERLSKSGASFQVRNLIYPHLIEFAYQIILTITSKIIIAWCLFYYIKNQRLKETQHINSSLSALSNVVEKLQSQNKSSQNKSSHVPYRDSKLTYLLRDSLGGNSKTLAIICCNPLSAHYNESLCSIRFAAKVNRVELKQLEKIVG